MKSLKTLVSLSALAVCMGAASMANAFSISPVNSSFAATGTLTVKSPSSFQQNVTCNVTFNGSVDSAGVANIATVTVGGSNSLCSLPQITGTPWALKATSLSGTTGTGTVSGVGYTIAGAPPIIPASNCGPSTVTVSYNNTTKVLTLSPAPQPLGSSCTLVALSATVSTGQVIVAVP